MAEESLLQFPCEIPVKVLGRNRAEFRVAASRIVRRHYADLADDRISEQHSRNRAYVSLTFVVYARSREEIDALYRDLTADDDVMLVL